jgi:hypothetical protein
MNRTTLLRRRVFLGGLTIPALVPTARAQGSATPPPTDRVPFGLIWGMSRASARQLEIGGADDSSPFFRLPLLPYDSYGWVRLSFGYRDRLFQVDVEERNGDRDMTRYKELSSLLSELHGSGTETVAAQGWFGRADPGNRSLRKTWFRTGEVSVLLSLLSGSDSGNVLCWNITYWYLPGLAEFQADDHSHKKDAL